MKRELVNARIHGVRNRRDNSFDFGFVNKKTGQVVRLDKRSGNAYDLEGRQVTDVENIVEGETYRKQMGIQATEDRLASDRQAKQNIPYEPTKDDQKQLDKILETVTIMDRITDALDGGMEISGLYDGTVKNLFDRMSGSPRADIRNDITKLRIDSALINVAQTKGAISEKEMDLFLADAPNIMVDDEDFINDWIKKRRIALVNIGQRILTGKRAGFPASFKQFTKYKNSVSKKQKEQALQFLNGEINRKKNAPKVQTEQ